MKEITCPKCHTTFQVDDSAYAAIIEQVRSKEFACEITRRAVELQEQFAAREEAIRLGVEKQYASQLAGKDTEMGRLQAELVRLQGIIDGFEATKRSELTDLERRSQQERFEAITAKDREIASLTRALEGKDSEHRIAMIEQRNAGRNELQERDRVITELRAELNADRLAAENREAHLRELHKQQMLDKQNEIDRLKDFRLKLSTKMVGETLEQHCFTLFARAQSMGLYPDALFEKDNIAVEHSKGDFIFRDYIDGQEYVSVMFEMKNEMDATATKHRNDDFLEKLDRDRQLKGCEYAVLVSMLEQGSELYDAGIVDKSHRFPKMIVIRPQFFMPVLRLITEGARRGFTERRALQLELEEARSRSLDFTKFEERINRFRDKFSKNVTDAHKKFVAATEGIDKTIEALEKQIAALRAVKANFEASEQKLLKANELAEEDLTVKKLTHGTPGIRRMIEQARGLGDGE